MTAQHANKAVSPLLSPAVAGAGPLQRKCACGAHSAGGGPCRECRRRETRLQRKRLLGSGSDPLELEADRIADQVLAASTPRAVGSAPPHIQRFSAPAAGQADTPPPSVDQVLASPGVPLEPILRLNMEQRFGRDFSRVQVHSGGPAEQSALDIHARAYTAGHHIVFGRGMFAPATKEGQRLLAHELTHVVQQAGTGAFHFGRDRDRRSGAASGASLLIQRQPDKRAPATKTLKSEGVDLNDPVAGRTAALIDEVLLRNRRLAPYIGDRLKGGFRISEKGKFVRDSTDGNFDDAYRKAYELSSSDSVSKGTTGFFDPKKSEIHVRPGAIFGTALHESLHRLASPALYSSYLGVAGKVSTRLMEVLKEGVTAFFTDTVLNDEGLPDFNDAYRSKKKQARGLIASLGAGGFDLIARFNFKGSGIIEIGEKLGFTRQQFSASKGNGIPEVMKRMDKTL